MNASPRIMFAYPGSGLERWTEGLCWFWRAGGSAAQASDTIGFGRAGDLAAARESIAAGEISGAVIFLGAGDRGDGIPAAVSQAGIARFESGSVRGAFGVFGDGPGRPALRSSLGVHAVRLEEGVLAVAADPQAEWGQLDRFWVYPLLAAFVAQRLERPIFGLPPIGALRLDDIPGNAQQQMEGRDHPDSKERRRIHAWVPAYVKSGSVLNLAVPAQALNEARERVPLDQVWPDSIRELAAGVQAGAVEPVCHGLLHLDTAELAAGRIEFREFGRLSRDEAASRIAAAVEWQQRKLKRPSTFVAAAWAYGEHGLQAAKDVGIAAWLKPEPGPMAADGNVRETLIDGPPGHNRLDYRPFSAMAAAGIPPTVIFHGTILDARTARLTMPRDLPTLAALFLKRDIVRLPAVAGISWVGAGELFDRVLGHDARSSEPAELQAALSRGELVEIAAPTAA